MFEQLLNSIFLLMFVIFVLVFFLTVFNFLSLFSIF